MSGRAWTVGMRADGVAVVGCDVPGARVNTLRPDVVEDLLRELDRLARDPAVRGVVLRSLKPDSFIVGADIRMIRALSTQREVETAVRAGYAAMRHVAEHPKPVVAAVHGPALGGGLELALSCRARVLTRHAKTVVGLPEVKIGVIPAFDGLERLAERIGLTETLRVGVTGASLDAAAAARLGLATEVVSPAILEDAAAEVALRLAEGGPPLARPRRPARARATQLLLEDNPVGRRVLFSRARERVRRETHGHQLAPERVIDVLEVFASRGPEAAHEEAVRAMAELGLSSVARHLMDLFLDVSAVKADDAGARALDDAPFVVHGAGESGVALTATAAAAGLSVRLVEPDEAALSRALTQLAGELDAEVRAGRVTPPGRLARWSRITASSRVALPPRARLVIDTRSDDLESGQRLVSAVEAGCGRDAVIVSWTGGRPLAPLVAAASRPERIVGVIHAPPDARAVHGNVLVEVVRGEHTHPEVVAAAVGAAKRLGKVVIVVADTPGAYVGRILSRMWREAEWLLREGLTEGEIDAAARAWGFELGPFALQTAWGAGRVDSLATLLSPAHGPRLAPPAPSSAAPASSAAPTSSLSTEEIQMRCALPLVDEALRCLQEGVLRCARDGDVAAVLGAGFPAFRGGPLRYVDAVGPEELLRRMREYELRYGARWAPAPLLLELATTPRRVRPVP